MFHVEHFHAFCARRSANCSVVGFCRRRASISPSDLSSGGLMEDRVGRKCDPACRNVPRGTLFNSFYSRLQGMVWRVALRPAFIAEEHGFQVGSGLDGAHCALGGSQILIRLSKMFHVEQIDRRPPGQTVTYQSDSLGFVTPVVRLADLLGGSGAVIRVSLLRAARASSGWRKFGRRLPRPATG